MGGLTLPLHFAKQFWIFALIIFIAIIVVSGLIASSGQKPVVKPTPTPTPSMPTPTPVPTTLSFTVKAAAGINTVTVTNQNSGATIILTAADLPVTFNFKNGDTLTFKVSANEGYTFNAWVFGDGTFQNRNPYMIKPVGSFTMEARFLMEAQ